MQPPGAVSGEPERSSSTLGSRDIPLVTEARLGLINREVERLLDEGGDL
jgi:hypothetical protein